MKLLLIITVLLCQGCILVSDAKYQADIAMWQAKAEASKAWASNSVKPLATFTTKTGETFVVNNPNISQAMPVNGEPNAIVQGADTILNSTVAKIVGGGWAAGYVLGKVQGNYTTNGSGSISVTQDSNNPVDVTTRHTEGSDSTISEEANTTDSRSDYDNSTEDPVIVTQPEPVIVQPANPIIVTQPEPIIIQTEAIND